MEQVEITNETSAKPAQKKVDPVIDNTMAPVESFLANKLKKSLAEKFSLLQDSNQESMANKN